jgi:hypothetical protein
MHTDWQLVLLVLLHHWETFRRARDIPHLLCIHYPSPAADGASSCFSAQLQPQAVLDLDARVRGVGLLTVASHKCASRSSRRQFFLCVRHRFPRPCPWQIHLAHRLCQCRFRPARSPSGRHSSPPRASRYTSLYFCALGLPTPLHAHDNPRTLQPSLSLAFASYCI